MKILDSSVLIALFQESDGEDVLTHWIDCNHTIYIPQSVYRELTLKKDTKVYSKLIEYTNDRKINILGTLETNDLANLNNRYPYLGKGELEVIGWGQISQADVTCFCIIDDALARRTASKENINFSGTLAMISRLVEKGSLTSKERDKIFSDLKANGFRFPKNLFNGK